VSCEGVQHCLLFCLEHFICVKMVAHQFYLKSRKQRKVRWVGMTVMLFLVKKFPGEKEAWDGALSWCNSPFFCHQSLVQSLCI
jgi:hypothetical protein